MFSAKLGNKSAEILLQPPESSHTVVAQGRWRVDIKLTCFIDHIVSCSRLPLAVPLVVSFCRKNRDLGDLQFELVCDVSAR